MSYSKKSSKQTLKMLAPVKELLLSYTYFLNENHTSYIMIGYDTEDFSCQIILYKNNVFHCLCIETWKILFANMDTIETFFNEKVKMDFINLPHLENGVQFKLSIRRDKKCMILALNNKKLMLDDVECYKLLSLMTYINSIATWYHMTTKEIRSYFERYKQICIENGVWKLLPQHFFMTGETNHNFYNVSRIFNELPVLCSNKLTNELIAMCYNKINEDTNL